MTPVPPLSGASGQPPLAELFARYLDRQASAHTAGRPTGDVTEEVLPFAAVPAQPIDPRLAWQEAIGVARWFPPLDAAQGWSPPPGWPTLVAEQHSCTAVPFCVGNFPQMVRSLRPLLEAKDLRTLRPAGPDSTHSPVLHGWAVQDVRTKPVAHRLLALGLCRLARAFDRADQLLRDESPMAADWQAAWENEAAALAWHRGEAEEAARQWQAQPESVPVLFNRGMAALFSNQHRQARGWLARAVEPLAQDSGWYHLGRLYLALAQMHG